MDLSQIRPYSSFVLLALDLPGLLAGLADRHEPGRVAVAH